MLEKCDVPPFDVVCLPKFSMEFISMLCATTTITSITYNSIHTAENLKAISNLAFSIEFLSLDTNYLNLNSFLP